MAAGRRVKEEGLDNDLIDRIAGDEAFDMTKEEITSILDAKNFIGRAPGQVDDFIKEVVKPILDSNKDLLGVDAEVRV